MALNHDLATPFTQAVLQLRARRGELGPPVLDQSHRNLQPVQRPIRGLRRDLDDARPAVVVGLTITEDWRVPEDRRRHGDQ